MDLRRPFLEHLEELRRRMLVCLLALVAAGAACFPFASAVLELLKRPAPSIDRLVFFGPEEALVVLVRVGLFCGAFLAAPVVLWQAWAFLAPAVGPSVRRSAGLFVAVSTAVFILGGAFAYYLLLPAALTFLLGLATGTLVPLLSAARYVAFVTNFILACGLVFQMPVVMFFLGRLGVVRPAWLRRHYGAALVVIFILAAVITPTTDIVNMLLLAVPMVGLYEISIWSCGLARRGGP
ncbi:MAG: twin-arginine translocase subunit TatC [Deltaproteobacteria bacterium]